jgi:hypothetical protein
MEGESEGGEQEQKQNFIVMQLSQATRNFTD